LIFKLPKEHQKLLPLAQNIVAMNIDISELLSFDTAVNQTGKQYNLRLSTAAFCVFSNIREHSTNYTIF
jgi:hypothetical protein